MIGKVDILRRIPGALLLSAPTLAEVITRRRWRWFDSIKPIVSRLRSRACWSNQSIA